MTTRFPFITLIAFISLSFIGCADEEPEPTPQGSVAEARIMLAPLEAALASPSGEVSPEKMDAVFGAFERQGLASGPLGFIPGAPGASPMGGEYGACYSGNGAGGTIDLACASSGEVTGFMTFTAGQEGDALYMTFEYDNVCSDGYCIDGSGAYRYTTFDGNPEKFEALMSASLEISDGGSVEVVELGFKMTVDGSNLSFQYVVFVDGESYVVEVESDLESWVIRVTGENGTWTCTATATDEGWTGSCEGSGSFEF